MSVNPRKLRWIASSAAALAVTIPCSASAAISPSLKAQLATAMSATCPAPSLAAFSPFGDPAQYTLVPGGTFEGQSPWTSTSASMVSGNEPWFVNSKADTKSLSIAKGGTATSPPFCVTALSPSLRFFARSEGKSARLDVDVIYTNPQTGANDYLTAGTVGATTNWAPTPQMLLWANLLSAISPSGTTNLALRFTAVSGTWFVDDVYVDPFRKG